VALRAAEPAEEPPPTTLPPRPIADSVERVVQKLEEARSAPCRTALQDEVPCFPVSLEVMGPRVSVRDSLRDLGPAKKPSPSRPPTLEEMAPQRPGPVSLIAPFVTFDPGCVAKSALKQLKGRNDTYYLYRLRDVHGERVALYDHRLDAAAFQGTAELLGRFEGECEAVAAYRREDRQGPSPGVP
jgi:hypothetical protein